jgi:hypothetical protein
MNDSESNKKKPKAAKDVKAAHRSTQQTAKRHSASPPQQSVITTDNRSH